jgi:hypothetical protein
LSTNAIVSSPQESLFWGLVHRAPLLKEFGHDKKLVGTGIVGRIEVGLAVGVTLGLTVGVAVLGFGVGLGDGVGVGFGMTPSTPTPVVPA